jgi:hypothetical protein
MQWIATLQTNQRALDYNNTADASRSLRVFSMQTETQAICLSRAWTPPRMHQFADHKQCHICSTKFAVLRRACTFYCLFCLLLVACLNRKYIICRRLAHKFFAFSHTVACSRQIHHIQATVAIAVCAFVETARRRYVERMNHESSRLLAHGLASPCFWCVFLFLVLSSF